MTNTAKVLIGVGAPVLAVLAVLAVLVRKRARAVTFFRRVGITTGKWFTLLFYSFVPENCQKGLYYLGCTIPVPGYFLIVLKS